MQSPTNSRLSGPEDAARRRRGPASGRRRSRAASASPPASRARRSCARFAPSGRSPSRCQRSRRARRRRTGSARELPSWPGSLAIERPLAHRAPRPRGAARGALRPEIVEHPPHRRELQARRAGARRLLFGDLARETPSSTSIFELGQIVARAPLRASRSQSARRRWTASTPPRTAQWPTTPPLRRQETTEVSSTVKKSAWPRQDAEGAARVLGAQMEHVVELDDDRSRRGDLELHAAASPASASFWRASSSVPTM